MSMKLAWPGQTAEAFKVWAGVGTGRRVTAQASHLCKVVKYRVDTLVDGSTVSVPIIDDFSACFNPAHVTMEPLPINMSRKGCNGGVQCDHQPKCILIALPQPTTSSG